MSRLIACIALALALAFGPSPAAGQIHLDLVASGLTQPVAFVQDPSNPAVQYVVQQGGRIRVLVNGAVQAQDFLNLSGQITAGGEMGLLGMAMAPDYAVSGRFWLNFNNLQGHTVIARFLRSAGNALVADPLSRVDLLWPGNQRFITQPFGNHKGGNLQFGPDGYLYIGMGDGGSGDDPFHHAQNPQSLLGKMLRIDVQVAANDPEGYDVPASNPFVGQPGVLPEIWAFGLRNPWRWSFDDVVLGGTGALIVADVGQGRWEEVNYEPFARGGRNYGWRNREGANAHLASPPPFSVPLTDPIIQYDHSAGASITGGYVYRGAALGSAYRGRYFYADFVASRLWSVALTVHPVTGEATANDHVDHSALLAGQAGMPSSFGTDMAGELYVLAYGSGRLYRFAPDATPGGCGSPDPFVGLGGGVCSGGNWYPPGYPIPGATPPAPTPTPTPTPVPTPPPTGCTGPDPFAGLGGGTCASGNWYPPGYPIPNSPPTPTPPPTPPPAGCGTPDPFAALGGGTCVSGNWYPPGYPIPAVRMEGIVRWIDDAGGYWVIQTGDGQIFDVLGGLPAGFERDGLTVQFEAKVRGDIAARDRGAVVIELVTISERAISASR